MLINTKNYDEQLYIQKELNKILSYELTLLFEACNLNNIHLASWGNSVSSGYSKCDEMYPFLARSALYTSGAPVSFYSYARVRKNEELNVIKWYRSNISHAEINHLLISDILAKKGRYACFTDEHLAAYQKMANGTNLGMLDFVKLNDNIIIYNGLTGSFTDRLRRGNFNERLLLLNSFKEDFENLKNLLLQIYIDNPHTQIYICGLPDFMELGISNSYDKYIKKAIKPIPNARYIKGSSRNMLLKTKKQKEFDIHYNQVEYLQLLNRVFFEILGQFIPMRIKNQILESLSHQSYLVELKDTHGILPQEEVYKIVTEAFLEYGDLIETYGINKETILKEVWEYYSKYHLVSFGCTDRESVKSTLSLLKGQ